MTHSTLEHREFGYQTAKSTCAAFDNFWKKHFSTFSYPTHSAAEKYILLTL